MESALTDPLQLSRAQTGAGINGWKKDVCCESIGTSVSVRQQRIV